MKTITALLMFLLAQVTFAEIPNCSDGSFIRVYIVQIQRPDNEIFTRFNNIKSLRVINIRQSTYYLQGSFFGCHQEVLVELAPLVSKYNAEVHCQSDLEYRQMFPR